MVYIRRVAAIFLMGLLLAGFGFKENTSEKWVQNLQEGRYEEAVKAFEEAVEDEVNAGDAYR